MLRNYFLINMVLLIILGMLGFNFYKVALYSMDIPTEASVEKEQKSKDIDIKFKGKVPDKASFQIISSKNLFKPTRASSPEAVVATPKNGQTNYPKLFATIIRGSNSTAIIQDPGTKKTKSYSVNELVAGYLITEILEDRVMLLSGETKVEIKLRTDKGVKASRPKTLIRQNIEKNTRRRPAPVRRAPVRRVPKPDNGK